MADASDAASVVSDLFLLAGGILLVGGLVGLGLTYDGTGTVATSLLGRVADPGLASQVSVASTLGLAAGVGLLVVRRAVLAAVGED